jgi:uncharacterized protein (TIGR01319 family)
MPGNDTRTAGGTPPRAQVLVADIGSTITKLNAFAGLAQQDGRKARFLGQGVALTTVDAGNVVIGLEAARVDLEQRLGVDTAAAEWMASSSAAGGLRMTVHGLTPEMTLRAAREASLGAGAIVVFCTAGVMGADDVDKVRSLRPQLILLAGGVDYGDREVVVANARAIAGSGITAPVIYAGNRVAAAEVSRIFDAGGVAVFVVDNVYPRIDELNVEPVRKRIQDVFSAHIVSAPGMDALRDRVVGRILPTPGAVMRATELLAERLGNVMTIDVGGATTDVHSVTRDAPEHERLRLQPEPCAKRTVEGDLGVYLNARHVLEAAAAETPDLAALAPLPQHDAERNTAIALTRLACRLAVARHVGRVRPCYGVYGRTMIIEGRDLSVVQFIIGTGGALTRLGNGCEILSALRREERAGSAALMPPASARVLLDRDYLMAAAGVLAERHPESARRLLLRSLGIEEEVDSHG